MRNHSIYHLFSVCLSNSIKFFFVFLFIVYVPSTMGGAASSLPFEYKVKAAYLLNFTRYIEWPETAFTNEEQPFHLCVLGTEQFSSLLNKFIEGRTSHGRTLQVIYSPTLPEKSSCHLVFIDHSNLDKESEYINTFKSSSVLTVGESDTFIKNGGVINLKVVEKKVRFQINLNSSQQANLQVSSRMLELAEEVYP